MKVSRGNLTLHATLHRVAWAIEYCVHCCARDPDRLPTLLGCMTGSRNKLCLRAQALSSRVKCHWSFTAKLGAFRSSLFGHSILGAETQTFFLLTSKIW